MSCTPVRSYFTCEAHEVEVGDRLLHGVVTAVHLPPSPKGAVTFVVDGPDETVVYGYAGTVIVLTGQA